MDEGVDDGITCRECGRWFRSVARHVLPAHGLTSDEYRLRYDIPMSDPLMGATSVRRYREAGLRRVEADPQHLNRMWEARSEARADGQFGSRPRAEATAAAMARRRRATDAHWAELLAEAGWSTWGDAADWAIDANVGWVEVGERLGVSDTAVRQRARAAGVLMLDRRLTPLQTRMLKLAQDWFDEVGTLRWVKPRELSQWLSQQRRVASRGGFARVHVGLEAIDPGWLLRPERSNPRRPRCAAPDCDSPTESMGMCQIHHHRRLERERRDAVIDPAEQKECLECGQRFRSVGTHVWQVHGLRAAEYRARHGIADAAAMNADAVRAKRQADNATPEAKERVRRMQLARWGGPAEERWAQRFQRAGWSGWEEAAEWAMANNQGWRQVAERLGCADSKIRQQGRSAGVEIPPPLSERQLAFLELARSHAAVHGNLASPQSAALADWLNEVRQSARNARTQSRCYLVLDGIDPEWRTRRMRRRG